MMPRHDCLWNSATETALSNPEPNTSNDSDGVTTSEEEFDYDLLLGPPKDPEDWDPKAILKPTIPEVSEPLPQESSPQEPMEISHPNSNETFAVPPTKLETRRPAKPTTKFLEFLKSLQPKVSVNLTEAYEDPKTLKEALSRPDAVHWRLAWNTEMTRLEIRKTWEEYAPGVVPEKKPIKSKYTFRRSI